MYIVCNYARTTAVSLLPVSKTFVSCDAQTKAGSWHDHGQEVQIVRLVLMSITQIQRLGVVDVVRDT